MHLRPSSQPAFVRSVAALFAALAFACSGGPAQSPTQTTPPPDTDGGTVIAFRHTAFGFVPDEYREGVGRGWTALLDRTRNRAEANRNKR